MDLMKYIDIHTHSPDRENSILNIFIQEFNFDEDLKNISSGIHPWHIKSVDVSNELKKLEFAAKNNLILSVGEIGLDKKIQTDFNLQKEIFKKQLLIAEKYSLPVIIHCVKAFNELISVKKEIQPKTLWIIHGFNNNLQVAKELIKHNCFLSFGEAILKENSNAGKIIKELPLENVFFETDESDVEIEIIYKTASEILGVKTEELTDIVNDNFLRCFRKEL